MRDPSLNVSPNAPNLISFKINEIKFTIDSQQLIQNVPDFNLNRKRNIEIQGIDDKTIETFPTFVLNPDIDLFPPFLEKFRIICLNLGYQTLVNKIENSPIFVLLRSGETQTPEFIIANKTEIISSHIIKELSLPAISHIFSSLRAELTRSEVGSLFNDAFKSFGFRSLELLEILEEKYFKKEENGENVPNALLLQELQAPAKKLRSLKSKLSTLTCAAPSSSIFCSSIFLFAFAFGALIFVTFGSWFQIWKQNQTLQQFRSLNESQSLQLMNLTSSNRLLASYLNLMHLGKPGDESEPRIIPLFEEAGAELLNPLIQTGESKRIGPSNVSLIAHFAMNLISRPADVSKLIAFFDLLFEFMQIQTGNLSSYVSPFEFSVLDEITTHLVLNKSCALHDASSMGNLKVVEFLIQGGLDVDKTLENGVTPLILAIEKNHTEIVQTLLQSGANISQAGSEGAFPLFVVLQTLILILSTKRTFYISFLLKLNLNYFEN
jgi:hypothetical protein